MKKQLYTLLAAVFAVFSLCAQTTTCTPASLPYFQPFNTGTLPACWSTAIVIGPNSTRISLVTQGSNPATNPAGVGSHFVQYESAHNLNVGSEERLISPPLNTTGIASIDVNFFWRADNNAAFSTGRFLNEGVQVQYSIDNGVTWINAGGLITRHDPTIPVGTALWKPKLVTLPAGAANKPVVFVAFKFHSEQGDNMFFDIVAINATPACYAPTILPVTNVVHNGARINWTAPAQVPLTYEVYYSTSNTVPTNSTVPTVTGIPNTSTFYDVTGLAASTTYYVWVRSNCGGPGTSIWSLSTSFKTLCTPVNVPYTLNFDAASLPPCTAIEDANNDGNTWTIVAAPVAYSGNILQYQTKPTNAGDDWFYTSGTNLTGGTAYTLRFKCGNNNGTVFQDRMKVYYGTGQSVAAMTTLLKDFPAIADKVINASLTFTPAATGVYYFGFYAYSLADQSNLYLDDISLNAASAVPVPVTLLNFSGQRQGNANLLRWTVAQEQNVRGYEIQRSENNIDWTVAGTVSGLGNITAQRSYTFPDNNPAGVRQYYRLRMLDIDGTVKLSNTILIKGTTPSALAVSGVFPNPAASNINLLVDAPRRDDVTLVVMDATGRVLQTKKAMVDAGANTLSLNVAMLAQGSYVIKVTCENGCDALFTKFIKQ